MDEKTLAARLSKAEQTLRRKDGQIAELQSERDGLRNQLAGGTSAEAGQLRARLAAAEADLARAEQRRKDAQESQQRMAEEWGAALDEAGDLLLKAGVPVPLEGYRQAPVRLAGDLMTALNTKPAPAESED